MNLDERGVRYLHAIMICYGNPRTSLWDLINDSVLSYEDLNAPKYSKAAVHLLNMLSLGNGLLPREDAYRRVMAAMRDIISPPKAPPNRGPQPRKKWTIVTNTRYF